MLKVRLILLGYGNVGREIVRLVSERREYLREKYEMELVVSEVIGSRVCVFQWDGVDLDKLLGCGYGSEAIMKYCSKNGVNTFREPVFRGDVFIDAAPTDITGGQPGLDYISLAIKNKMNIVSVAKGALVVAFGSIMKSARENNVVVKYSGAAAAALPTIDMGQYCLAGTKISSIEGILNGTTNYILTRMFEDNISFEEALIEAKSKGIAETNSELDIKGVDSACKILLLSNSLLGTDYSLKDIVINGIEKITIDDVMQAKKKDMFIKLIASAYVENNKCAITVRPLEIRRDNLLAGIVGTNKGVVFSTDTMGKVAVLGGASNPRGAAAAALKDILNIYRGI